MMVSFDWEIACFNPSYEPWAISITEIIFLLIFGDNAILSMKSFLSPAEPAIIKPWTYSLNWENCLLDS